MRLLQPHFSLISDAVQHCQVQRSILMLRRPYMLLARPQRSPFVSALPSRARQLPSTVQFQKARIFSTPLRCRNQQTTFSDPFRPDLFYHLVPPPTPQSASQPAFAVSLLESPPPKSDSRTILGWLPAEAEGQHQEAGLNDFKENRELVFCIQHI